MSVKVPVPGHGGVGVSQAHVTYAVYDDGSTERITHTGEDFEPVLTKPGRIVDEAQYSTAQAALDAANQRHLADLREQEGEGRKDDYDTLVLLGVPEALARRVSRYKGQ